MGCGPPIWGTVYISEVNGARKVRSDMHVVMSKKSDHVQKFIPQRRLAATVPPTQIFFKLLELSKTSRARTLISGLQVNIDRANSRRYDVTR